MLLPTTDDSLAARDALRDRVRRTPVLRDDRFDEAVGPSVFAKAECLQATGSFKVRGALNRIRTLPADALRAGLITVSAGNAALGAAYAAREYGATLTVVMPENVVPEKLRAVKALGAETVTEAVTDATVAFEKAAALQAERGLAFVHPFDDPMVIAGASTATIELLEDCPTVTRVLIPCSGGGLLAGAILAARTMGRDVEIIGVQPEGADGWLRSLAAGAPTPPPKISTISDGLTAPKPGATNFEMVKEAGVQIVTVSDEDTLTALGLVVRVLKVVIEPAAAVTIAALLTGKVTRSAPTGVILSGGNVKASLLAEVLSRD